MQAQGLAFLYHVAAGCNLRCAVVAFHQSPSTMIKWLPFQSDVALKET